MKIILKSNVIQKRTINSTCNAECSHHSNEPRSEKFMRDGSDMNTTAPKMENVQNIEAQLIGKEQNLSVKEKNRKQLLIL